MAAPRLFVTNHHVVEHDQISDLRIRFPDNKAVAGIQFPAKLIAEDPQNDLAVLEVECDVPPLNISDNYSHTNGQRVVAIGSPSNGNNSILENFTTDGRLGPAYTREGITSWTLSMATNPGNSGGPVVDATTADVVAVLSAGFTKTESQSIAVPHPELTRILRAAKAASQLDRQRTGSLHRQRWCIQQIAGHINEMHWVFSEACKAASKTADHTGVGQLKSFLGRRDDLVTSWLDKQGNSLRSSFSAELAVLEEDPLCDRSIKRDLKHLLQLSDTLEASLRKNVSPEGVEGYLNSFGSLVVTTKGLSDSLALRLDTTIDWSRN